MIVRPIFLVSILCFFLLGAQTGVKSYSAQRFDVDLQLNEDGSMWVRETVVFNFTGGPFTYVYRDLHTQDTDGIADIQAWMDGRQFPVGNAPGQVEISTEEASIRVTWHLPQTYDSTHTFMITYRAWGVVRREKQKPVLKWWAIPQEHGYVIERSTINLEIPASLSLEETVLNIDFTAESGNPGKMSVNRNVFENEGVILSARFIPGAVDIPVPGWQTLSLENTRSFWLSMLAFGLLTAFLALIYLHFLKRNFGRKKLLLTGPFELQRTPPGDLPAALAGKLIYNREEPLATLFDLAHRGNISIQKLAENKHSIKKFAFRIIQEEKSLEGYEKKILFMLKHGFGSGDPDIVTADWLREYGLQLESALERKDYLIIQPPKVERPSLDQSAGCLRSVGFILGFALIAIAWELPPSSMKVTFIGIGWLFLGIMSIIELRLNLAKHALHFTEKGYQVALAWRGFAEYLKRIVRGREGQPSPDLFDLYLPYAAAFGLYKSWVRTFRKHPGIIQPGYFQAALGSTHPMNFDSSAFTSLAHASRPIYDRDSDGGGWGGGGGGSASGGGGSGAG